MRELKFRAFDDGKMFYSHNNITNNPNFQVKWFFEKIREDAFVMQFTGLKDKNGKEIYEGDIMNSEENGRGVVQWNNNTSCFEVFVANNPEGDRYFFVLSYGEVLGNIHENPELLK